MRNLDLELFKKIDYVYSFETEILAYIPKDILYKIFIKILKKLPNTISLCKKGATIEKLYARKGLDVKKFIEYLLEVPQDYEDIVKEELFALYEKTYQERPDKNSKFYAKFDLNQEEGPETEPSILQKDILDSFVNNLEVKSIEEFKILVEKYDQEFLNALDSKNSNKALESCIKKYIIFRKVIKLDE